MEDNGRSTLPATWRGNGELGIAISQHFCQSLGFESIVNELVEVLNFRFVGRTDARSFINHSLVGDQECILDQAGPVIRNGSILRAENLYGR